MTFIVGIDPGAKGAIAVIGTTGQLVNLVDMPYADGVLAPELTRMLRHHQPIATAWVERAQSMPNQSAPAMFKYGIGYGVILGVLGALEIPTETVRSNDWKPAVGIPTGSKKDVSRRRATELFPSASELFARAKDDGRAEAALIGRYGFDRAVPSQEPRPWG